MNGIIYSYLSGEDQIHKAVELYYKVINEPGGGLIYRYEEDELILELKASASLGAWDMERLVGFGFLILDEEANKNQRALLGLDENSTVAEIGWYVDYDYRGKGIAKTLTDKLTDHAENIGISILVAKARKENIPSNRILSGKNFIPADECDIGDGHQRNVYIKYLTPH